MERRAEMLMIFFFSKDKKTAVSRFEHNTGIDYFVRYIEGKKEYGFGVILKATANLNLNNPLRRPINYYKRFTFTPLMVILVDLNVDKLYYQWVNSPLTAAHKNLCLLDSKEYKSIILTLKNTFSEYTVSDKDKIYFKNNAVPYQGLVINLSFNHITVDNTILEVAYFFNGGSIIKLPLLLFKGDREYTLMYNESMANRLRSIGHNGELFVERIVFTTLHQPFHLTVKSNYPIEPRITTY
jgi:hypothetical protein